MADHLRVNFVLADAAIWNPEEGHEAPGIYMLWSGKQPGL